jgi:general secretion pathway protein I
VNRRAGGFTLLEILAALALIVIVLTVMLAGFGQARRSLAQVRDSDRLSQIARTLLDEQRDQRVQAGVRRGEVAGDIRWVEQVTRLPSDQGQLPVFQRQLTLNGPGETQWQLVTLIAQRGQLSEPAP